MGQSANISSSSSYGIIRPLGAFEELFWLLDQSNPQHFSVVAEIDGPTTIEDWRLALDAIQRRHPLLSACIEETESSTPHFRHVPDSEIPLRIIDDETQANWEQEVERELTNPFNPKQAPLIRAVLLYQSRKTILIFSVHHSIGDGISGSFLVRDVLRALSGQPLETLPLISPVEEMFGLPRSKLAEAASETLSN